MKSVPLSDAAGALIVVLALRVCFGMRPLLPDGIRHAGEARNKQSTSLV